MKDETAAITTFKLLLISLENYNTFFFGKAVIDSPAECPQDARLHAVLRTADF